MTDDDQRWNPDKVRLGIARDLREIQRMFGALETEAFHHADDPDIPGGAATVMLGPRADVEAWTYVQMSAAAGRLNNIVGKPTPYGQRHGKKRRDIELAEITGNDIEPPLSFLAGWADIVAENRGGAAAERTATIEGEIKYLSDAIEWMTATDEDGVPWWLPVEDFAKQLKRVRAAMENALRDGNRSDRINAECKYCDEHPRLIVRKGKTEDTDFWQCPNCHHAYDESGVSACWTSMLVRRPDAPEWIPLRAAAAAIGRGVSVVYSWTRPPTDWEGKPKLDRDGNPILPRVASRPGDNCVEVFWANVRAIDETTQRRRRTTSEKVA